MKKEFDIAELGNIKEGDYWTYYTQDGKLIIKVNEDE